MIRGSVIAVFCILFCWGCSGDKPHENKPEEVRAFQNTCTDTLSCITTIQNSSAENSTFSIKSSSFYLNESDIADVIQTMQKESPREPLERIAWLYVINNFNYCKPFSEETWLHHPELMLNSLGNGLCDDLASVLAFLWRDLGFESRVWIIEGHAIPEVLVNGQWHMYDPSYQVYYLDENKGVASVEDISADTTLMSNYVFAPNASVFPKALASSLSLKELYFTSKDNYINDGYKDKMDSLDVHFILPGNSTLTFPIKIWDYHWPYVGGDFPNYSYAEIEIEDNKKCIVKAPLVLHNIKGEGTVLVDGKTFNIGSEELRNYIETTSTFIDEIAFPGEHKEVKLHYFINEKLISGIGKLALKGHNLKDISVKFHPKVASSDIVVCDLDSAFADYQSLYQSCKTKIDVLLEQTDTQQVEALLKQVMAEMINCDSSTSQEERQNKLNKINAKLDYVHELLGDDFEPFFKKRLTPSMIVVIITYLEKVDQKAIKDVLLKPQYSN